MKLLARVAITVLLMAVGAAGWALLEALQIVGFGKGAANDSPVQVPTGSLSAFAGHQSPWTKYQNYNNVFHATLNFSPDVLHLDGVNEDPKYSTSLEDVWIKNITSNWTITLDYRDSKNGEDRNTKLQICTNVVTAPLNPPDPTVGACDDKPDQSPLSDSKDIYMVAGLQDKKGLGFKSKNAIDGDRQAISYDVASCPDQYGKPSPAGDDSEIPCNHIHEITVSQLKTVWWDFWTNTDPRQYHCVDGKCDIWIGKEKKSK
jgi:hypothetical protein